MMKSMAIFRRLVYSVVLVLAVASFARGGPPVETSVDSEVSLYFADVESLKLSIEKRTISQTENIVEQIKLVVSELTKGPATELAPTIPAGTSVREVFLDEKGCAYVDFSAALSENHPGGTTSELVTIASIVNTLTKNFPEAVQKVRIIIDGKEAETIAGHIDISRPIFPFEIE